VQTRPTGQERERHHPAESVSKKPACDLQHRQELVDALRPTPKIPLQAITADDGVVQIASGVISMRAIVSTLDCHVGFGQITTPASASRHQDPSGSSRDRQKSSCIFWLGREGSRPRGVL
jgi:hypothetical protein